MKFTFPPESRPLPGYTIKRAIDRGGFGEVYYALSDAGKEVALKLLQHNFDVELRGVRQCLNLRHPNLITIFDIRTDEDEDHWIIMEYAGGRTLEQTLENKQPLPPAEALPWIKGIADGVEFLHARGLVHRDLKPGNIFADQGTVKVGDVGLSKFITPSRRSAQTESVGTVHYMAPEVARGRYGNEVDVYAAGIILYEMLVGKVPFEGESTAEILMKHLTATPDLAPIPESLRPLLARALEKDPERRLHSLTDLARGLEQFVAGAQPVILEQKRETHQQSTPQPVPQPVLAAASANPNADELDHFWRLASLFFRPEYLFLRSIGGDLYRFWKRDVPIWIRWPVVALLILLSPVWILVLLASTPWLLFTSLAYFGIREVVRVAIWMVDPTPNTHPWSRLFGRASHSIQPPPIAPAPQQTPPVPPVTSAPAEVPQYAFQQPSPVQPAPQISPAQLPGKTVSFFELWLCTPILFGLALFAALLFVEALHSDDVVPTLMLMTLGLFVLLRTITSRLLNQRAIPSHNRRGLNLLLLSLAGSITILGLSGIELLKSYPRSRMNDEGWMAIFVSFGAGIASLFLLRRRLSLTTSAPAAPTIPQPPPQVVQAPSAYGFGGFLLRTFLFLLALGVSSIILSLFAYRTTAQVPFGEIRIAPSTAKLDLLVLMIGASLLTAGYFLFRRNPLTQPSWNSETTPLPSSGNTTPTSRRTRESWLIAGFLALWAAISLFGWKGIGPTELLSVPSSWTALALITWSQIILLTLLVRMIIPKIPLLSERDNTPRLVRTRLTTGFLQSLLWSFLLAAGFTLAVLAIAENMHSRLANPGLWDMKPDAYLHAVWLFSFLTLSSWILLAQAYGRARFGFLNSSSFFTLLVSGCLIAAVKTGVDLIIRPIMPTSPHFSPAPFQLQYMNALQFLLPILVCGGWIGQMNPARSRRFRISRLIWVILVTAVVAGLLEYKDIETWVILMGALSCLVQLGSPWIDPEPLPQRAAAPTQPELAHYNVTLVQGA